MTVYELTDLLQDFSKIDKDFCQMGKVDEDFKLFLDTNFGFYSDKILIGCGFGSNILYQYDFEAGILKSSFNNIQLSLVTDWKLSIKDEMLILSLYDNDVLWCNFYIAKLTFA